jgi:hypothetical protein
MFQAAGGIGMGWLRTKSGKAACQSIKTPCRLETFSTVTSWRFGFDISIPASHIWPMLRIFLALGTDSHLLPINPSQSQSSEDIPRQLSLHQVARQLVQRCLIDRHPSQGGTKPIGKLCKAL